MKKVCNGEMAKASMNLLKTVTGVGQGECAMLCALDSACQSAYVVMQSGYSTSRECQLQRNNIEAPFLAGRSTVDVIFVKL